MQNHVLCNFKHWLRIIQMRCDWVNPLKTLDVEYHDTEWGVPVYDDKVLFEFLILEGAQAGLSWSTILKRREGYRKAFWAFDPQLVAKLTDAELEEILKTGDIIRNRLKVFSARQNAIAFLKIQNEFGSFAKYLWGFVDGEQIVNSPKTFKEIPAKTELSDRISKDLKKRGMNFVGSTILYAYLQAVGVVSDHTVDCFKYKK